jgi:hypothetical protein
VRGRSPTRRRGQIEQPRARIREGLTGNVVRIIPVIRVNHGFTTERFVMKFVPALFQPKLYLFVVGFHASDLRTVSADFEPMELG